MVYTALGESLVTNITLGFASCYICHLTLPLSCIHHTTGGSALSNTYGIDIDYGLKYSIWSKTPSTDEVSFSNPKSSLTI